MGKSREPGAADALIAVGFAFAGWSILNGIKNPARFCKLTIDASSDNDLNEAAKRFVQGVTAMGVGAVIAILAPKMAETSSSPCFVEENNEYLAMPRGSPTRRTGLRCVLVPRCHY